MNFKVDQGPEGLEVELPALELINKLGYDYKNHFELEVERDDFHEALLYKRLRKAIEKLNDLDEDEIDDALNQIHERNFPPRLDSVEANERVRIKLVGISQKDALEQPIQVKSIDEKGNPTDKDVRFFDFENPENNDYLVTNQFKLVGLKGSIECDVVVFVNGIPLVIIECKKPTSSDYLQDAFDQNFTRYQGEKSGFEKLFFYNHMLVATCGIAAKYGTIQSGPSFFSKWSDPYPMKIGELEKLCNRTPSPQDILLAGILNKKNLLNMLENFVIYQTMDNKLVKLVSKHQQLRVVTKALKRMSEGDKVTDKGGVIWHTQGSGKSYSMVWFATQLMYKFKNPAMMIITDRKQLDKQIKENFEKTGYPNKIIRAKDAKHLGKLLENPHGQTIMSTLQKFGTKNQVHTDKRVIVLVDEAHRTQYGYTAADMRNAMPNAVFFGFTGTPIAKKRRVTVDEFGGIIDKYSFMDAIKDGVTLPVKHHGLYPEVYVEGPETLDEIFDRVFSELDEETKAKLKQRYGSKAAIAEAPERIKKICDKILKHYQDGIEPDGFKAMIVATTREAAVLYKRQLDKIGAPPSKIIMTSNLGEKGKDGLSWDEFYLSADDREKTAEKFTKKNDPTKFLIVVDMLLTGFDCPILKVMYLDKVLKEHTLLQAIARVNRVYTEQKKSGEIIDFIGVTRDLGKAFENYDDIDMVGALDTRDTDVRIARERQAVILDHIKSLKDKDNSDILLEFETAEKQESFAYDFKLFSKAIDELLPSKEAKEFEEDLKFSAKIQTMIRTYYHGDKTRIKEYGAKVQQIIDDHIKTLGISELIEPREINPSNFGEYAAKYERAAAALMRNKAETVIRENKERNPGFYEKLSMKLEALIAENKARLISNADYVKRCESILQEAVSGATKRMQDLGITTEYEFAVFENLTLQCKDEKICQKSAKIIAEKIQTESETKDWREKSKSENIMYYATYDTLDTKIFSEEIREKLANEHIELARRLL
jgi:type I restriction enzyme, R subunit